MSWVTTYHSEFSKREAQTMAMLCNRIYKSTERDVLLEDPVQVLRIGDICMIFFDHVPLTLGPSQEILHHEGTIFKKDEPICLSSDKGVALVVATKDGYKICENMNGKLRLKEIPLTPKMFCKTPEYAEKLHQIVSQYTFKELQERKPTKYRYERMQGALIRLVLFDHIRASLSLEGDIFIQERDRIRQIFARLAPFSGILVGVRSEFDLKKITFFHQIDQTGSIVIITTSD